MIGGPTRVAVTGLGIACPLGVELDRVWARLVAGDVGFTVRPGDASREARDLWVGAVPRDALDEPLGARGIREADLPAAMALHVVGDALESAGLPTDGANALPHALVVGCGHGNIAFQHDMCRAFEARGRRGIRPTSVVRIMFNRVANVPAIRYKLTGPNHVVSAACASGAVAFGEAFHKVRHGIVPGAVAACTDSGLEDATLAAWDKLGMLSREADSRRAARPFAADRVGLVIGEGAAAFVLEPLDAARARGASILAEVVGYGAASDAAHIVQPEAAGEARAIRTALADANVAPTDERIDYVNLHGTGTAMADQAEAAALVDVFGSRAASIPCSNPKAQIGHLMGAAAGVELALTVAAMHRETIPPLRNLDEPDPECRLGFVTEPTPGPIRIAVKNAFAFGGSNAVVVLRRVDED